MPMCAQIAQFIAMNSPDQVPLLAAASLRAAISGTLMANSDVLGPFKSHMR